MEIYVLKTWITARGHGCGFIISLPKLRRRFANVKKTTWPLAKQIDGLVGRNFTALCRANKDTFVVGTDLGYMFVQGEINKEQKIVEKTQMTEYVYDLAFFKGYLF